MPVPQANPRTFTIADMPLRRRSYWVEIVSSMEQVIGTVVSAVVGIMIPMMQLVMHPEMSSLMQGIMGSINLVGIGFGSVIIGRLSDRFGYLLYFRLCPLILVAGSLVCFLFTSVPGELIGLFFIGFAVGGGYSLDSAYISELMPDRWRGVMVGVAKSSCAIGFIAGAILSLWIILGHPTPDIWNRLILIVGAFGVLTFLMRIRWAESPQWLAAKGRMPAAQKAVAELLGPGVEVNPPSKECLAKSTSWAEMFRGKNILKVIYSGIPWACEGLGVYGFGVFLPVIIMALGIESAHLEGMPKIIESVKTTAVVNCFIVPGFVLGLLYMHRLNHVKMLSWGFILSAAGLGLLLWAYLAHLPVWVTIAGFLVFEVSLNAGPHLITYIIPTVIYPVVERGAGTGIASMLGKVGAVVGVILMPVLLHAGGMVLVLVVSIAVMLLGALISIVFGKLLKLM